MIKLSPTGGRSSFQCLVSSVEATSSAVTLLHLRLRDERKLLRSPSRYHLHSVPSPSSSSFVRAFRTSACTRRDISHSSDSKKGSTDQPQPGRPSSSSIYPHSRASLRPNPNARARLFGSRVYLEGSPLNALNEKAKARDADPDLADLYKHQRIMTTDRKTGNVESVVNAFNFIARYHAKKKMPPTKRPYLGMLEALSYWGLLDECYAVLDDMQDAGIAVDLIALNFTLKAASNAFRQDDVYNLCQRINQLQLDDPAHTNVATDSTDISSSKTPSTTEDLSILSVCSTRNFTTFTYACLFSLCFKTKSAEQALLLFSALVNSRSSSVEAMQELLAPGSVKCLIDTLLTVQEFRLAVEIAEWIHRESAGRLVPPTLWTEIASACAVGDYYPGLKHAYRRGITEGNEIADEGFVLAALATASRAPDSEFCHLVLQNFLVYSTQWVNMRIPDTTPPPILQHAHLLPLVEALCREGKFEEAIRIMGTISYWGLPLQMYHCPVMVEEARRTKSHLYKAAAAWNKVLSEGSNLVEGEPEPIIAHETRPLLLRRVAEGKIPALAGRVEIRTLNSLLEAAARLGEDDEAMRIWESRKLAVMRPSLSRALTVVPEETPKEEVVEATQFENGRVKTVKKVILLPTVETLNSLLGACVTSKHPSVTKATAIFDEFLEKHSPRVSPDAASYKHLIRIILWDSVSGRRTRVTEDAIREAFVRLEEAKARGIVPSSLTYELMIRACLRGCERREDVRWWRLADEMMNQAKHGVPQRLLKHIALCDRSVRDANDGNRGLSIPTDLRLLLDDRPRRRRRYSPSRGTF